MLAVIFRPSNWMNRRRPELNFPAVLFLMVNESKDEIDGFCSKKQY